MPSKVQRLITVIKTSVLPVQMPKRGWPGFGADS